MVTLFLETTKSNIKITFDKNTEVHLKTQKMSHFLFGVSAKHFKDEVSTTVSQNATTGSATLISAKQK